MNNNDVLRKIRYIFDYSDDKMINLFADGSLIVDRVKISEWLKKDDDEEFVVIKDVELAAFLNGFIIEKRGKREGEQPLPEKRLNNNIIMRKLKIALNMKDSDMLACFDLVDFIISKHELSAFFRKPTQKQYRICKDQFLRNFMLGMQFKYRAKEEE